jgi:hypothetical protein
VGVEAKSSAMALAAGGRDSVEVRDIQGRVYISLCVALLLVLS